MCQIRRVGCKIFGILCHLILPPPLLSVTNDCLLIQITSRKKEITKIYHMIWGIHICPKLKSFNLKTGTRIDFGKLGELPYANCYVCNKNGHLAGNCPDGKGLYPQGGSCRVCGSVNHLAQHCPSKNEKKEQVSDEESVIIEQYLDEPTTSKDESKTETKLKKKRKVVTF